MNDTTKSGDTRAAKVEKISQACIRCRQKKIKCDGRAPPCSNCAARNEECVYRGYQRRRGPGRSKQHVRALEQRLSDLEALLQQHRLSRKPGTIPVPPSPGHRNASATGVAPAMYPVGSYGSAEEEASRPKDSTQSDAGALRTRVENLKIKDEVYKRMPIFKMVSDNMAEDFSSPAVTESLRRIPGQHIPVRQAEIFLIENTIQEICDDLPIFDVHSFKQWARDPQTLKQRDRPSQWACLNAVVGLSMLMKTLNRSYRKIAQFPWAYLKNAYSLLPEVMVQCGDIWGVQAVLIMAMFMLRASGDLRTAATFLSIAVRMMQTSGLHLADQGRHDETRARVVWSAYILDAEISLSCGLPPLLRDDDIDLRLPHQPLPDTSSESLSETVFPLRVQLATIQAHIRQQLYSAKAFRLSDGELTRVVAELALALDVWRSGIPVDIRPGEGHQLSDSVQATSVIMQHLVFYNCISMVHWAVHRQLTWGAESATPSHPEISASRRRVESAARAVVHLLPRIKTKSTADVWRMLPYLLAPALSLLAFIIRDPTKAQGQVNLETLETLVSFMETLVKEEGMGLTSVLRGCVAMRETARNAIGGPRSGDLDRMTHPMLVVQVLLGNVPNRDANVARSLSAALSVPWDPESPFSTWVPEAHRPDSYGFKYGLT